jgi:hypothetical protein
MQVLRSAITKRRIQIEGLFCLPARLRQRLRLRLELRHCDDCDCDERDGGAGAVLGAGT